MRDAGRVRSEPSRVDDASTVDKRNTGIRKFSVGRYRDAPAIWSLDAWTRTLADAIRYSDPYATILLGRGDAVMHGARFIDA